MCGRDVLLQVIGQVCRGGRAEHGGHHSQAEPQPVWSPQAETVRFCLPRGMPERCLASQLFLLSGSQLDFVVDQRIDHGPTLGPTAGQGHRADDVACRRNFPFSRGRHRVRMDVDCVRTRDTSANSQTGRLAV